MTSLVLVTRRALIHAIKSSRAYLIRRLPTRMKGAPAFAPPARHRLDGGTDELARFIGVRYFFGNSATCSLVFLVSMTATATSNRRCLRPAGAGLDEAASEPPVEIRTAVHDLLAQLEKRHRSALAPYFRKGFDGKPGVGSSLIW